MKSNTIIKVNKYGHLVISCHFFSKILFVVLIHLKYLEVKKYSKLRKNLLKYKFGRILLIISSSNPSCKILSSGYDGWIIVSQVGHLFESLRYLTRQLLQTNKQNKIIKNWLIKKNEYTNKCVNIHLLYEVQSSI